MNNEHVYIKLVSNEGLCNNKVDVVLKDNCNNIIFRKVVSIYEKIKLPVFNRKVYKLLICSGNGLIQIPLYALNNQTYYICIDRKNFNNLKHRISVLLFDSSYPEIKIREGEMILWQ